MATALHKALEASALHGGSGQGLLEGHGEASSPVRLAKAQHVMFCTPNYTPTMNCHDIMTSRSHHTPTPWEALEAQLLGQLGQLQGAAGGLRMRAPGHCE